MIQYSIPKDQLEGLIEAAQPGWLERARERTEKFASIGRYEESSSIWSEVKIVYMRLQHGKCAYCERQLESEQFGSIEHDLEHFRPKKKAKAWVLTRELQQAGIVLTAPVNGNSDSGYHLLAYNPLNYCTSCKSCNSGLKSDSFPIEGQRSVNGNDPVQLRSEMPLLINPVGNYDDDPASLITFYGLSPMACGDTAYRHHRGLVSIAFFHLDDRRRKYLFSERADIIVSLYSFMELAKNAADPVIKQLYQDLIEAKTKPSAPHTNCARSYRAVYLQNLQEAKELFQLAANYLKSISGPSGP